MPATRTATASARCTSTRWRVSGHCSAPGCVRIAASRRRSCQSTSASLSSCTTRAGAEKPCSVPLSLLWSDDVLRHPGSRQEPKLIAQTGGNHSVDPDWIIPDPDDRQIEQEDTRWYGRPGQPVGGGDQHLFAAVMHAVRCPQKAVSMRTTVLDVKPEIHQQKQHDQAWPMGE